MSVLNASVLILTIHDLVGGTNALLLLMILNNMVIFNIILIRSPIYLIKKIFIRVIIKIRILFLKLQKYTLTLVPMDQVGHVYFGYPS